MAQLTLRPAAPAVRDCVQKRSPPEHRLIWRGATVVESSLASSDAVIAVQPHEGVLAPAWALRTPRLVGSPKREDLSAVLACYPVPRYAVLAIACLVEQLP